MADTRTLKEALEQTYRERWAGTRSEKTTMSQATAAMRAVCVVHPLGVFQYQGEQFPAWDSLTVAEVLPVHLREVIKGFYQDGLSPATINKRLNCLSAMGINVEGCRVKNPKKLQWWLRPEVEEDLVSRLREQPGSQWRILGYFIAWTTKTGLRIEESLALRGRDFSDDFREVTVPGTKTGSAQATLALGSEAQAIARRLLGGMMSSSKLFATDYEEMHSLWSMVRRDEGFTDPTATLKALRRSAARYLHYDRGMPLDMVRQYLRHENIETTMGYLRLTGGVSLDEQRRYLG